MFKILKSFQLYFISIVLILIYRGIFEGVWYLKPILFKLIILVNILILWLKIYIITLITLFILHYNDIWTPT